MDMEIYRQALYATLSDMASERGLTLSGLSKKSELDNTFLNPCNTIEKDKRFISFKSLLKIVYIGLETDLSDFTKRYESVLKLFLTQVGK